MPGPSLRLIPSNARDRKPFFCLSFFRKFLFRWLIIKIKHNGICDQKYYSKLPVLLTHHTCPYIIQLFVIWLRFYRISPDYLISHKHTVRRTMGQVIRNVARMVTFLHCPNSQEFRGYGIVSSLHVIRCVNDPCLKRNSRQGNILELDGRLIGVETSAWVPHTSCTISNLGECINLLIFCFLSSSSSPKLKLNLSLASRCVNWIEGG